MGQHSELANPLSPTLVIRFLALHREAPHHMPAAVKKRLRHLHTEALYCCVVMSMASSAEASPTPEPRWTTMQWRWNSSVAPPLLLLATRHQPRIRRSVLDEMTQLVEDMAETAGRHIDVAGMTEDLTASRCSANLAEDSFKAGAHRRLVAPPPGQAFTAASFPGGRERRGEGEAGRRVAEVGPQLHGAGT